MSAVDVVVGYPKHAVAEYHNWTNPHGVKFVDWRSVCGASGTETGHANRFGLSGSARKGELCRSCWPTGHSTRQAKPMERAERITR